jgi:enterochelin esterase family protein
MLRFSIGLLVAAMAAAQEAPSYEAALKLARAGSPELKKMLGEDRVAKGTASIGQGPDFLFAVDSAKAPKLLIDEEPGPVLKRAKAGYWWATAKLQTSRTHNFSYLVDGKPFGGANDVPAWGPDSYEKPGVPKGTLDGKHVHTSKLYEGMASDYWIYVPQQYNPATPAAVMVWQDGEVLVKREQSRNQIVFDNLTHEKKIPVIIHVLVSPGTIGGRRMRSVEYDTMDDRYPRFIRDEILPEVAKKYSLRTDGYSRAIAGDSSGGICAFNAAYTHPELFTRVLSRIGSFTSIQWRPGQIDGGNVYPFKIRKDTKRNIRVWLQDGAGDLENEHGSWPATNIAMANSLKYKGYDFKLAWGNGTHNRNGGHAELAEEMVWLWRDYDPAKTSQEFAPDPAEKDKPYYRVKALNRE